MRYHLTPVRMAIIKPKNKEVLARMWRHWNPVHCSVLNGAATVVNGMAVPGKTKHRITI